MKLINWFVENSLTPIIIHQQSDVMTVNSAYLSLKHASLSQEQGLEAWLKKFFIASESLQALLTAIVEKKTYCGDLQAFSTGIKAKWRVQTLPFPTDEEASGEQITYLFDLSKDELMTAYWDLHIKMNEAAITLQGLVDERTLALQRAEESEQKAQQLAQAIQYDKDFLNIILNNLKDGIVACDNTGKITVFNNSLKVILNLPEQMTSYDEWSNYFTLYEVDSKVALTQDQNPLLRALRGETLSHLEYIAVLKKQGIRNIIVDGQPILNIAGQTIGAVIAIHDITERNVIEKRLIQSEKMAVVGRLATGIAHELNQPLTIIRANLQTLELLSNSELSTTDLLDLIATSIRQVDRAAEIIARMRKFAIKMHKTGNAMNIIEPIEAVLLTFEEQFRTSGIAIIRNFEADLPLMHIDAEQFEQIICNLLSNAKYAVEKMKQKSQPDYLMLIRLDLTCDKINNKVVLDIIDNGIGMNEEILRHCLEPFFTAREVGEGAGLGLTTVYNVVKLLNGQVDVISQPDKGTTIRISLPVDTEQ